MRSDPFFLILALIAFLGLAAMAPALVPADLSLTYPFMDGDSHDWIANGLRLAGEDVRYSGRAPLLPLTIALLDRLSALSWLPLLLQGMFRLTALAFYSLAARLAGRRAAFVAALALLVNDSLLGLSLQVMADVPAACLLFLAARSFLRAPLAPENGARRYLESGLFAGLSALTQSVGALWVPAAALTAALYRRHDFRSPWLWASLLPPLAFPFLWRWAQPPAFGGSGGLSREQWLLLDPHAGSVPFYLYALLSLLGLPGALLLAAGLASAARRARREEALFLAAALFAATTFFFVFLYDYNAKRFLVYGVWFGGLFMAEALGRLRSRPAFAGVSVLLVAFSALPLPASPSDPSVAGLWPAPPVYVRIPVGATATGSATLAGAARIERGGLADWRDFGHIRRAWEARGREASFAPVDPGVFAADQSALYLYEQPTDGGGRYRTLTHLGNALRRRVKLVPASYFAGGWAFLDLEPLGCVAGEYAVYRARLPGLAESWLLAATEGSALHRRLARVAARATSRPAAGRAKAEAIRGFIADSGGFVALVPVPLRADLSQLYLPFLLETTELYVAEPGRRREMLELLGGAPVLAERSFGTTIVRKTVFRGRKTALVSYRPLTGTAGPLPGPPPPPRRSRRSPPARGAGAPPGG
ncbi:MAG TPA: glycosyltransferase family 39 protein [Thermoanaerobaculia bacterium]|nr:glycosyltransferase family 39 protein [Thermoanaerobaculia bacterium]